MISHRSKSVSTSGLALVVALALAASSCLSGEHASHHSLDVKAETEGSHVTHATGSQHHEPEYFEGAVAPEMPAARHESRTKAPSTDHVWVAGHHTRRDGEWVWVSGRWTVPPSEGAVWVPGHWVGHLHGYLWIAGAWR
jgi:hypothetical protein